MTSAIQFVVGEGGRLPTRGTPGSAGLDLYASKKGFAVDSQVQVIPTAVRVAIPPGYVGLVQGRSGLAKGGLLVITGTIDSDYRGEIGVLVTSQHHHNISPGDRIAQLVIVPCHMGEPVAVDALDDTERGGGGFGSTGAR